MKKLFEMAKHYKLEKSSITNRDNCQEFTARPVLGERLTVGNARNSTVSGHLNQDRTTLPGSAKPVVQRLRGKRSREPLPPHHPVPSQRTQPRSGGRAAHEVTSALPPPFPNGRAGGAAPAPPLRRHPHPRPPRGPGRAAAGSGRRHRLPPGPGQWAAGGARRRRSRPRRGRV